MSRADRAPDELAAAVRADAVQDLLRAVAAPGALVGADEHVRRRRVEIPVAAFAVRPQLQHLPSIGRRGMGSKHACARTGTPRIRGVTEPAGDFNTKIIEEFRSNAGKVGGPFASATVLLLHHTGWKSGTE